MRKFILIDKAELPDAYDAESCGGEPIVEVKESERQLIISYHFSGFFQFDQEYDVEGKKRQFNGLEITGLGYVMASGKPQLPSFGRYVQIPSGSSFRTKVAKQGKTVKYENIIIAPAQTQLNDGLGKHNFEFDETTYASDDPYPRDLVSATGPMMLDGYNALLIHVCPFQYHPKSKTLIAYSNIEVTIELTPADSVSDTNSNGGSVSREVFGNLFLNPGRSPRDTGTVISPPIIPPIVIKFFGPELLIVYATPYQQAAQRLADWKNRRGLITELFEYKAASMTFASLKAEIRNRRSFILNRLRYVVLIGDVDDIPTEESARGCTTDYYLSTQYDTSTAQPLPTPWLALGRIPVRSNIEALSIVDQIVAYEQNPPSDPAYYHRFVCAAHFETHMEGVKYVDGRDYAYTIETIRAYLASLSYDAERVYTYDNAISAQHPLIYRNGVPVPTDVVSSLMPPAMATQRLVDATTEGHLIIAHRDHGGVDGWTMPPFKLGDLDRVTGSMPSMFYSVNCSTGAWDQTITTECFAEKVLRLPGTAPTLIASTELSNTWLNNAMMLGLFDAMYGGLLPTFPNSTVSYPIRFNRFGDVVNYARAYVRTISTDTNGVLGHHEMYHVLGDSSLEVWRDAPKSLVIKATQIGRNIQITLSAPAPDCVVTIWYGSKQLQRLTPTGQRFTLSVPTLPAPVPLLPRIAICAWVPGFHFAQTQITIR